MRSILLSLFVVAFSIGCIQEGVCQCDPCTCNKEVVCEDGVCILPKCECEDCSCE